MDCLLLDPSEADRQLRDMIIGLRDLDPKILLSCSEDALLRYLPTIVCIINSLPMWYQLTKKEVIRTLEQVRWKRLLCLCWWALSAD